MRALASIATLLLLASFGGPVKADYAAGSAAFNKKDYATAGIEFEKAAKAGNVRAMVSLGSLYAEGLGVDRDDVRAFEWYLKAAEAGYGPALGAVARLYSLGKGVAKSDPQSLEWGRKAAEKGDPESQYIMGIRHAQGLRVERDPSQALLWFAAAAEQGLARAQYSMGYLLAEGAATTPNANQAQTMRGEAYKWLLIAQRGGSEEASRGIAALKPLMTPEHIAAAEKSAAAFKPIQPYASPQTSQGKP